MIRYSYTPDSIYLKGTIPHFSSHAVHAEEGTLVYELQVVLRHLSERLSPGNPKPSSPKLLNPKSKLDLAAFV